VNLIMRNANSPQSSQKCALHPLIHTLLGFTLAQDIENALHKIYAVVNEGEGEGGQKKFPTLECYESGEVRDGMKNKVSL